MAAYSDAVAFCLGCGYSWFYSKRSEGGIGSLWDFGVVIEARHHNIDTR
jgi:hypothetical protein